MSASYHVYQLLRHQHGLNSKKRKKAMESDSENDEEGYESE